jgi:hypothetical protein
MQSVLLETEIELMSHWRKNDRIQEICHGKSNMKPLGFENDSFGY